MNVALVTLIHGVKKAIAFLINLSRLEKKFKNLLTNDRIAKILVNNGANLNDIDFFDDVNIYDDEGKKLSFWDHFNRVYANYPLQIKSNQYQLVPFVENPSSLYPIQIPPVSSTDKTLIRWATRNRYANLADILIKGKAYVPRDLLPSLREIGVDTSVIPANKLI